MVGGVNPAKLPKPRDARGTTAEDPIVVEEEPSLPQQPSIGKRPVRAGPADPSQLPHPTSEQILGSLLQQKNVFPVVVSLLRLLAPGAPSLAAVPPNYPSYPYSSYGSSVASAPSWTRSQSPEQTAGAAPSAGVSAPPLKRRKLNSVPAGAADWDVPYPFQEGQGPENYRTNWERERSKQLLADLVHLVKGAAQKAATKTWYQQQQLQRRQYGRGVLVGYGPEPTVNKYYRPKTMYYGLERAPVAPSRPYYPYPSSAPSYYGSGSSTPSACISSSSEAGMPPNSFPMSPHDPAQATPEVSQLSTAAFDHLVESLLTAQQQQEQVAEPSGSAPTPSPATSAPSPAAPPSFTSEDNTQALFDNWLEMLTAFPPGDPNEGAATSPTSPTSPADTDSATSPSAPHGDTLGPSMSSTMATAGADLSSQIPDCLIDPALLDLAINSMTEATPSTSSGPSSSTFSSTAAATGAPPSAPASANVQSATPSLVDSPTVTNASLPDPGDTGPATPTWDWAFPEGQDAPSQSAAADMKALEQWVGMDVDVDVDMSAIIDEQLASALPPAHTDASLSASTSIPTTTSRVASEGSSAAPPQHGTDTHVEARAELGAQPHPRVQSAPSLPEDDALRQGLGAQHVSQERGAVAGDATRHSQPSAPSPAIPAPLSSASSWDFPQAPTQMPAATALGALPAPFVSSVAHAMALSARVKGKGKAIPWTGNGVGSGGAPPAMAMAAGAGGKQTRKAVLERARKMRAALAAEVERAKVALWETTLEQGVLVGFGRELEKEKEKGGLGRTLGSR